VKSTRSKIKKTTKERDKLAKIKATVDPRLEGLNKTLSELNAKVESIKSGTPRGSLLVPNPPQYVALVPNQSPVPSLDGSHFDTSLGTPISKVPVVSSTPVPVSPPKAASPPLSEIEELVPEKERTAHHTPRMYMG
jgi:hypothetical protein